jgi:4-alpha-glucanotransferase/alpha-amylase
MLSLLFGVHAHQPAGNFPEVFEHAHVRCYKPFLEIVHRYPDFRFAVHFSGPLLDYLFEQHPHDMQLLAEMVERGQVEMFGAGDTEPVLASIPERDRIGQVERLSKKLEWRFGQRPTGAWLTERVWEATVVPALARTGIDYVTVDDYHFLCTGKTAKELDGYFTTEEGGHRLHLFPISEQLRYRFPFSPAADAVAYLEELAANGDDAAIYFDDIEKFGIWPETYQWVYERGWLREFIERVLASRTVRTQTFQELRSENRTRGIVYLPTTSYIEMNEWTLPAEAAHRFADLVAREKAASTYEAHKPFIRGGIWKNFLTRYPEANWMHKRMTGLSQRLEDVRPHLEPAQWRDLETQLYLAQANDAYWHGLFGGVYMPHLRRGIYKALVTLESALDRHAPRPAVEAIDLDRDGVDELVLHNEKLQAIVKLDGTASICELDAYELGQNFGDTLRRHAEHYHRRALEQHTETKAADGGIASAHDRFRTKHEILPADVVPDPRGRGMFHDTWNGAVVDTYGEDLIDARTAFVARVEGVAIRKRMAIREATVRVDYVIEASAPGKLEVTLDIAMPCCDGYAGRVIHDGEILGGFGQPLGVEPARRITLDDRYMNGSVTISASRDVSLRLAPYYTVSQSEDGLEKVMQAVTLALVADITAGTHDLSLTLQVGAGDPLLTDSTSSLSLETRIG